MSLSLGGNLFSLIITILVIVLVFYIGFKFLIQGKKKGFLDAARGLFSSAKNIVATGEKLVEDAAPQTKISRSLRATTTGIGRGLTNLKEKLENAITDADFGERVQFEISDLLSDLGQRAKAEKDDILKARSHLTESQKMLKEIEQGLTPERAKVGRIEKMMIGLSKIAQDRGAGEITSVAVIVNAAESLKTDLTSIESMIGALRLNIEKRNTIISKAEEKLDLVVNQLSEIKSNLNSESEEVPLNKVEEMVAITNQTLNSITVLSDTNSEFEELCVVNGAIIQNLSVAMQKLPIDAKRVRDNIINVRAELKQHHASALERVAAKAV